jgi:hypothetical protein
MSEGRVSSRSGLVRSLACALAITSVCCSSSANGPAGAGGTTSGGGGAAGAGTNGGSAGTNDGGGGTNDGSGGTPNSEGGSSGGQGGSSGGAIDGGTGGTAGTAGTTGAGGVAASGVWKNYEVSGSLPNAPVAVVQKPGQLKFTKIVIQDQFLAESCAIGDYNGDGIPDVSSGRIWYEGTNDRATTFQTQHPFRDGHGSLPRAGAPLELNTGVSDDWADYPWDMDGDGDTDIINIAQCDVPEANPPTGRTGGPNNNPPAAGTPNKIGTVQVHATAYWYENPGKGTVETQTANWTMHLMNADVRNEQHELVDFNGDGYPEIVGACRDCGTGDFKGYYQGDPMNPTNVWTFYPVGPSFAFPFGNVGWMHGMGAGDVNGDGRPDWFDRRGAWLQQADGSFNDTPCTGRNTPVGCGVILGGTPLLPAVNGSPNGGFYDGLPDGFGNKGGSHMFAVDIDKDGCADVVSADWEYGMGLAWYQQQKDAGGACNYAFKKFYFLGNAPFTAKYQMNYPAVAAEGQATMWGGVGFTEPTALQVYDMDGDGRPDIITGKMRFAKPYDQGCPDPDGTPYLYVFKNVATTDTRTGSPITLTPFLVDGDPNAVEGSTDAGMGVGRQIAIGHVNTDGIMDICVSTKLGLAVFLGQ